MEINKISLGACVKEGTEENRILRNKNISAKPCGAKKEMR